MAPKKRLDFEFNGYQTPAIPRAPRSIRKRGPRNKSVEGNKLCAFELLAAVAGQLLQESEGSTSGNAAEGKAHFGTGKNGNQKGQSKEDKALKLENYDRRSWAESAFIPEISVQECSLFPNFKELTRAENGSLVEHSYLESSDSPNKVDCDIKLVISEGKNPDGVIASEIEGFNNKVGVKPEKKVENDRNKISDLSTPNRSTVKDPSREFVNTDIPFNSESSVDLSLYRDPICGALLRKCCNRVNLGIKDDDENSFGCNKIRTKFRSFQPHSYTEHHRIRKMLKSKYWKVAPKVKDYEFYSTRERMRTFCRYKKIAYAQKMCQRVVPFKKRKLSDNSFAVAYNQDCSSDSIFPKKGAMRDECSSSMILHGASGASINMKGHQKAKDPYVRFSIKSFTVPELRIEIPETATIGSLKRHVMETVTSILRGGIRIGVVLQGKKVRDNNITLQQACISQSCDLNNLDFTLESNCTRVPRSRNPEKPPLVLPCDTNQQLRRSPATPGTDSCITHASDDHFLVNKLDNLVINNELISSPKTPNDLQMDVTMSDSKALVCLPPMNMEALPVAIINPKHKHSELSQRRTRRPFSVQEVEALVEAVEKLGTGRWRDIKMRAFENADHRTYVDLKDKWKTLVHTGSISPQQRRGEPVPQELLDRVLAAHSYWSQKQAKQGKKTPKIIVAEVGTEGA